jgi:LacI family transcriptional regulator
VTIKHVAREAGVSVATVSRVINETGPVAETTRRRIREVTERLRYVPHGAARSLITNRTNAIGVLLPDIHGEFFSEVIRGIDVASRHRGYHLLVSSSHGDRAELAAVLRSTRGRVDGLIVMSPDLDAETLQANLPETLPIITLNDGGKRSSFDSITVDNYGGALAMTRHLLALGHTRVGFIKGPANNIDAAERLRGYRDAMRPSPAGWSGTLEIEGGFTEESGFEAGVRLLALVPRPTAVFAGNDAMAIGALSAFRDARVGVPAHIALAGFDDIPISRFVAPSLTTVRVSIAELGTRATVRLLEAIQGGGRHQRRHETLPTGLVVRGSCGAVRSGAPRRIAGQAPEASGPLRPAGIPARMTTAPRAASGLNRPRRRAAGGKAARAGRRSTGKEEAT